MAKVSFTKLSLKTNQDIKTIEFNGQIIEVKQYLSINDKLILITNVIRDAYDENNFFNPIKIKAFTVLEVVFAYTNINFTDKQKEDPAKLYDAITSSGLWSLILEVLPDDEYYNLVEDISETTRAIYSYKNSALGILESVKDDYSDMDLKAEDIQEKLADPENLKLLKDILNKLG